MASCIRSSENLITLDIEVLEQRLIAKVTNNAPRLDLLSALANDGKNFAVWRRYNLWAGEVSREILCPAHLVKHYHAITWSNFYTKTPEGDHLVDALTLFTRGIGDQFIECLSSLPCSECEADAAREALMKQDSAARAMKHESRRQDLLRCDNWRGKKPQHR